MGRFDHLPPITDEEEQRIQAGIAADPDAPELTNEELASLRPAREVLPPEFFEAVKRLRGQRSKKAPTKEFVSIRIDRDIVSHFKKGGPGWPTRLNNTLKKAIAKKR